MLLQPREIWSQYSAGLSNLRHKVAAARAASAAPLTATGALASYAEPCSHSLHKHLPLSSFLLSTIVYQAGVIIILTDCSLQAAPAALSLLRATTCGFKRTRPAHASTTWLRTQ